MTSHSLEPSDFGLPNDPAHPVLYALSRAAATNLVTCFGLITEFSAPKVLQTRRASAAEVKRMLARSIRLLRNAKEVLGWIYPSTSALSVDVGMRTAVQMRDAGFPNDWVEAVIKGIGKRKEGRPALKREIAVRAKEMRLTDPKRWTWRKVTAELCDCGGAEHNIRCQDNLRREILHLDGILKKHGCKLRPGKNPL